MKFKAGFQSQKAAWLISVSHKSLGKEVPEFGLSQVAKREYLPRDPVPDAKGGKTVKPHGNLMSLPMTLNGKLGPEN